MKKTPEEKNLKALGLDSHYLVIGRGKPVFLLHGWGGTKESWLPLLEALEKAEVNFDKLRFYLLDLPGFGETKEPPVGWSVSNYVHWFEDLIKQIYKKDRLSGNYDLIVHSFGGRMLMKMFDKLHHQTGNPQPDKLIMIAAAGIKPTSTWRMRLAGNAAKIGKMLLSWPILKWLAPLAQKVLYKVLKTHDYEKSSGVMRETFLNVIKEDLRDCLQEIKRPTLIFWGTQDSYLPVKDAYLIHSSIAGSKLHIIKEGRHGIHKTHASVLAPIIIDFLSK